MTTKYRRQEDAVSADLGDELAVLNLESGSYLGFNATAAYLWRLLEEPRSLDELCKAMTAEFAVDTAGCRESVATLLAKLEGDGLVIAIDR